MRSGCPHAPTYLGCEEIPTPGDESNQEIVNKRVKKAAIKEKTERQCALRINIKHTKTLH